MHISWTVLDWGLCVRVCVPMFFFHYYCWNNSLSLPRLYAYTISTMNSLCIGRVSVLPSNVGGDWELVWCKVHLVVCLIVVWYACLWRKSIIHTKQFCCGQHFKSQYMHKRWTFLPHTHLHYAFEEKPQTSERWKSKKLPTFWHVLNEDQK